VEYEPKYFKIFWDGELICIEPELINGFLPDSYWSKYNDAVLRFYLNTLQEKYGELPVVCEDKNLRLKLLVQGIMTLNEKPGS